MQLIFEKGRRTENAAYYRNVMLRRFLLERDGSPASSPTIRKNEVSRHYTELAGEVYGVNNGFLSAGFLYHEIQSKDE